jgi:hypothetical protein
MAKKKAETTEPAEEKKPAAKKSAPKAEAAAGETKAPAKKAAPKKTATKKPAAPAIGTPLVDTGLAAKVAASLIGNKTVGSGQSPIGSAPRKPSSSFQQLKDSLNKPATSAAVGNLLGDLQGKKTIGHSGFTKQVGHNQTFGSDASKAFVPRRTGG